jgi:hypothetical protein
MLAIHPPLAGAAPAKSAKGLRANAVSLRWDRVSCFAYSPAARGYACLDASAGADSGDPGLRDFETWTPPPSTAWHGHKAVVLVTDKTHVFPIAKKEYDHTNRIVHTRAARAAVKQAIARGFRQPVAHGKRLPIGTWKRVGSVWLRFETWMHEGDASYENHGSLRLSCSKPSKPKSGRLVVDDNQAEEATVFTASGADAIAVGFVEVDGGEGAEYYNTDYVRIDLRTLCP